MNPLEDRIPRRIGLRVSRSVTMWAVVTFSGCSSGRELTLPAVPSSANPARYSGLHAGFGRVDITPPPGVPMSGNGFEGQQADGYRQRLYARAVVLEGADGERIALVVADLPHLSLLLHRRTAEQVFARTGIGADRLMISVTHTHSGPGNFYEAGQYNSQASALPGYDARLTQFLVDGLTQAVDSAVTRMSPAVAAWGRREVPGVTFNRSLRPHLENRAVVGTPDATEAVDDTLRMLRIDQCGSGWRNCRPRAAFSMFAMHGTVMPPANTLIDGDVHGVVERIVEAAIDTANGDAGRHFPSRALHLFANANEGDVSPLWNPATRCGSLRRFEGGRWRGGPRATEPAEEWRWPPGEPAACLELARSETVRIGRIIGDAANLLHAEIGGRLTRDVKIARAFRTVDLINAPGLCAPRSGVSTFGGADDGRTSLFDWKLLVFDLGMKEGGPAARRFPSGCQGHKRQALGVIQDWMVGRRGLPTHAQVAVVRIGEGLIAAVPGEATTAVGEWMRDTIRREGPTDVRYWTLLGLANGYLQYITSKPEYALQHYEGGSTLYGPELAELLTEHLAVLAASIRDGRPIVDATDVIVEPGAETSYMPAGTDGPDRTSVDRVVTSLTCSLKGLSGRWIDVYPGRFRVDFGKVLEVQRRSGASWTRVAWDDSPDVMVRAVRPLGDDGYEWSVEWEPRRAPPAGEYRIMLEARLGMAAVPDATQASGAAGRTAACP